MAVSHETQTLTVEQQVPASSQEVMMAFGEAQQAMHKLADDPALHEACIARGIDPTDTQTQGYWDTVASYTQERVAQARKHYGESLRLNALELLAATPSFIFAAAALGNKQPDAREERNSRRTASHFNSLVRDFATTYPETTASGLAFALGQSAHGALPHNELAQSANRRLRSCIKGAQHELAFGQILEAAGYEFWTATTEEDLRGIDYVVAMGAGRELFIDVKSSVHQLRARGSYGNYAYKADGKLEIYSLVADSEFGDKFFISDEAATAKATLLQDTLQEARAA